MKKDETQEVEVTFDGLNISKELLFVLTKNKFTKPTPIQHQVIPTALKGNDVVGIAQTGTGKTLAFGIPMIQRLITTGGQGLILLPTRELAIQVDEMICKIGSSFKIKTVVLIGGASINNQIIALKRNPQIIIATPGRLADHLEHKTTSLKDIAMVVLDEADRMFDVGFAPQIRAIMKQTPKDRQTLLFSATMPQEIIEIANSYMENPTRVEIAPAGTTAEFVEQEMFFISKEAKTQLLDKVLDENKGSVLVFVRTRYGAKRLTNEVNAMGHKAAEIHSDRSLFQRKEALAGFKAGKYRVLIATDIAARGIDVKEISLVVNYDLPDDLSDYVHRIGRTGRNGCLGRAVSFVTKQERFDIQRIERMVKKEIKELETGDLPDRRKSPAPEEERFFGRDNDRNSERGGSNTRNRNGRNNNRHDSRNSRGNDRGYDRGGDRNSERGGDRNVSEVENDFIETSRNFDRKPASNDRDSSTDRKPFGNRRPPVGGRKPAFGGKPFGEKKSFGAKKPFGAKKSFGDKKPFGKFEGKPEGKKEGGYEGRSGKSGRSAKGGNDSGKSKFNGKRGTSNAQKRFR